MRISGILLFAALLPALPGQAQFTTSTKDIRATAPTGNGGISAYETRATTVLGPVTGTEPLRPLYRGAANRYVGNAKGYFSTRKGADGVWNLVDPEGYLFYSLGVNTVRDEADAQTSLKSNVRANTLGKWAGDYPKTMPYTVSLDYSFSYKNTQGVRGDELFERGILPIFDVSTAVGPGITYTGGFEQYCRSRAAELISPALSTDKLLLGYWLDNEVPLGNPYGQSLITTWTTLANYEGYQGALGAADPNYQAARAWVKARHGGTFTINAADKVEFPGYVTERYYRLCRTGTRTRDTNHLLIGSRLHQDLDNPFMLAAARQHLDVVTVNYYRRWTPDVSSMAVWAGSGSDEKPFIISEFYAMSENFGFENRTGAGWIVNTQQERADFFENFTLGLLANKNCVGFHWFRYQDDKKLKNNGLINEAGTYWAPLRDSYYKVARDVFNLRDWQIVRASAGSVIRDTYVRNGSYGTENYGSADRLLVKESSFGGVRRRGLITVSTEFNSASDIRSAKLKLYCAAGAGGAPAAVELRAVSATWYEGTVTYDNAPAPAELLATATVGTNGTYYTWDVTDYVRQRAQAGLHTSAFALVSTSPDALLEFNSRENASNPPIYEVNNLGPAVGSAAAARPAAGATLLTAGSAPEPAATRAASVSAALRLYPQPAITSFEFLVDMPGTVALLIRDLSGRVVVRSEPTVEDGLVRQDVAALPAGVYLLEVRGGAGQVSTTRFLKQ